MRVLKKEDKERFVFLYHLYTTLYLNDAACHWVKDTQKNIDANDKEACKKYGALKKRADNYLRYINKTLNSSIILLAEYNESMDLINDNDLCKFCNSIALVYKKYGIEERIAHIETMRILIELAQGACRESFRVMKFDEVWSLYEMFKEMSDIANDLWVWSIRNVKIEKEEPLDIFSYKSVNKRLEKIKSNIFDSDNFIRVYNKMLREVDGRI